MNRKIMTWLSYGFYFLILCIVFLIVYLVAFKTDSTVNKKSSKKNDEEVIEEKVEDIKLNKKEINLNIGGSFKLSASLVPSTGKEKILFESQNTSIATVDEVGNVKATGAGSTKIIVKVDGTDKTSECVINVAESSIVATDIIVPNDYENVKKTDTFQINVSIIPTNAVDKNLTFVSSDEARATVDENGLVTFKKEGYVEIEIKLTSNPLVNTKIRFYIN